uniref:Prolyl 4-hydroxylase alpha subunit Fe(2+) 2OG dioxygenase domain-containing protein n=1 Tax=viral metagenome TaxID=1070528 RepID=A0A6C0CAY9_9ZZZZ
MQFVQETFIDNELHTSIKQILSQSKIPFEQSQVYNVLKEEKETSPDIRMSQFRTLIDNELFDIGTKILNTVNSDMQKSKFIIYANDVMHIKYSAGGYFKEHEDYLSVNSNIVEEYTMLVCVDADCVGGETILTFNKFFKHSSKMTNTPGGCLIFRKDIPHEGAQLLSGIKEIISYNVWLIKNDAENIMIVDFENDKLNRKYFLSIADIIRHPSNNILKILVKTSKEDDIFDSKVIQYTDSHTFEEFAIVEKIINGNAVSYQEYTKYHDIIKYYLFDMQNIIMKAIEGEMLQDKKNDVYVNEDYIIFGNSIKYVNFVEDIKKYHLPYVPFKIMFAEGSVSSDQDQGEPYMIKMTPVWVSFSENDNIVLFSNFMARKEIPQSWYSDKSVVKDIAKIRKGKKIYLSHPEITPPSSSSDNEDQLSEYESSEDEPNRPNVVFPEGDEESWEWYMVFINLLGYIPDFDNAKIVNLLTDRYVNELTLDKYDNFDLAARNVPDKNFSNYSIVNNKLVLQTQHLQSILNKIKQIKLYESIISKLNDVTISSAQRSIVSKPEMYCNESVYGRFNLITIYGGLVC